MGRVLITYLLNEAKDALIEPFNEGKLMGLVTANPDKLDLNLAKELKTFSETI